MGGGLILIVDDDRLIRMATGAILEAEGYDVLEAFDGINGFEIIDQTRPDAVLLDVMMPGMNGREFLHTLRETRKDRTLPVIVMTALRGAMASQFLALGADDFIYKPFDQELLLNKVSLALVRRTEQDTLPSRPRGAAPRKVVLWVDRDRSRQREVDRLLSERGFTMVSVSEVSGELSRLARALEPRAIVLNMTGEVDSTLAAVRHLRDEPSLDTVPILATSPDRVNISALDAEATVEPPNNDDVVAFVVRPPTSAARQTGAH